MTAPERSLNPSERRRRRYGTAKKPHPLARRVGPVPVWALLVALVGIIAVVAFAAANSLSGPRVKYDVGSPGVGISAPDFELPNAAADGSWRLSDQRGKTVLLYFHEGLMCAPCWKQVDDIQADLAQFRALGVDEIAAISLDPLDAQRQRATTRGTAIAALADEDRKVSTEYDALSYGMMHGQTPGHTFILIGPDGAIRWRADYGGAPDYTMYVPNETILAELGKVLGKPAASAAQP